MEKWNMSNPKHMEQALEYFFSLPSDDDNSDTEADEIAQDELNALDNENQQGNDGFIPQQDVFSSDEVLDCLEDNFTPIVMPVQEADNVESSDDEMEESEWNTSTAYFENLETPNFRSEPCIEFEENETELNFFERIFNSEIISIIVLQTNLYASQKKSINWEEITDHEVKALIGCFILMSIHELPHIENYWSSDPVLRVEAISQIMTAKRFKKIIENIHCNNNLANLPRSNPQHDKLHKLRPIIDLLNSNIENCYSASSFLSVDESMIPFKGRSSMKQYMPMKPIKRGYKVWCLADSKTGYIIKFSVYTGNNKFEKSCIEK